MAVSCCQSSSQLIVEPKHVEWMKNLPRDLHNEPITKITIPGTHNSFAFYLSHHPGPDLDVNLKLIHVLISPIIKNWSITQNLTFAEQLHIGIHYFDLRVCRTTDISLSKKSPFTFTHGLLSGLVRNGLETIHEFLNKYSKEIVLLDFNDQYSHEQLIELIHEIFGNKICTTAETIIECQITPDSATIQNNPFSSLETRAKETNRRLIEWLSLRQRDPSLINGINVVIWDFANQQFTDTVIMLNQKTMIDNDILST